MKGKDMVRSYRRATTDFRKGDEPRITSTSGDFAGNSTNGESPYLTTAF